MRLDEVGPITCGPAPTAAAAARTIGDRPVAVVDRTLLDSGMLAGVLEALDPASVLPVPPGEPTVTSVEAIRTAIAPDADVIVAIGGGTTLDTAKLAGALARSPRPLADHLLGSARFDRSVPVVAVPTTAGSGAEVTRTCVVSHRGRKSWAWDDSLRPVAAVLDADLTLTMPPTTTVSTGLDAFVHALEAATAQTSHDTGTMLGTWAAGTIGRVLPQVVHSPSDDEARQAMLEAACAAGAAIDRCGTGIGHALGHALGSLMAVPHGLAVMLGQVVAIQWSIAPEPDRFTPVAAAIASGASGSDMPRLVADLTDAVGFEEQLRPFAHDRPIEASELAAEAARPDHRPMRLNNARIPSPSEHHRLAEQCAHEWNRIGGRT